MLPSVWQETDHVGLEAFLFTTGDTYARNNECGDGSPIQSKCSLRGRDSAPSGSEPVSGEVRPSCSRSLFLAQKPSVPSILLSGERRCTAPVRPVLASPAVQGPPLTSSRGDLSPSPGQSVSLGLTHERLNASVTGLPSRMIDTIQNVKAASTHSAYDRKWMCLNVMKHTPTHCSFSLLC